MEDLTSMQVRALREPGQHRVARCLYVQCTARADGEGVTRSWLLRYVSPDTGKPAVMGLGSLDDVSLATARQIASEAREMIKARGIDPLLARNSERVRRKLEASQRKTFGKCVEAYLAAHAHDWKNAKHSKQWETTLIKNAQALADLPVASIDVEHVLDVLRPLWHRVPETASRLRGRIEKVIDFAIASNHRKPEAGNPARWDRMRILLGSKAAAQKMKRKKQGRGEHHPAVHFEDIPRFMTALRRNKYMSARALEFLTLTAARTDEVIGATWAEIDIAAKLWTVPAGRMKREREHRVPLSDRALDILKALPREEGNPHVFIGKPEAPLSNAAMAELLKGMTGKGQYRLDRPDAKHATPHGMRSAFRDWAGDRTKYQREIIEFCLAHGIDDETEAAYRRSDALDKRRRLLDVWAKYCESPPAKNAENIVTIRSAVN